MIERRQSYLTCVACASGLESNLGSIWLSFVYVCVCVCMYVCDMTCDPMGDPLYLSGSSYGR